MAGPNSAMSEGREVRWRNAQIDTVGATRRDSVRCPADDSCPLSGARQAGGACGLPRSCTQQVTLYVLVTQPPHLRLSESLPGTGQVVSRGRYIAGTRGLCEE